MSHTPGPWTAEVACFSDDGIASFASAEIKKGKTVIASIKGNGNYFQAPETPSADARLIAAAPEMLDALECVLEYVEAHGEIETLRDIIGPAIKHARGES